MTMPANEEDFADVFGAEGAPVEDEMALEEDPEGDEALDAAIDEAMTAEDPAVRREAFKTAVRLCKEY
jgi:vacuolar-type H+-ATPase subunit B/Vma2